MDGGNSYERIFENYIKPIQNSVGVRNRKNVNCFERTLVQNESVTIPAQQAIGLDQQMIDFYSGIIEWKVKWKTQSDLPFQLEGSIYIMPLSDILEHGDSTFLPEENPVMRGFHLLDYFYNEGAVGFYLNAPERGLFMFLFDGDPQPLKLDFEGYLKLLVYTRGVGYWQNLILTHLTGRLHPNVAKIWENMPKLFPDFSEKGFIELYESVRMR